MKSRNLLAAFSMFALVACGGGGDTALSGINGGGIAGINGGGIAVGPVTGFGSVFVNGIEFSTTGSTITVEGSSASESQLKIGQVVEVRGTIKSSAGTGTATSIAANNQYVSPVHGPLLPQRITRFAKNARAGVQPAHPPLLAQR